MSNRILFICHRIPYPPNKGDKIRSYNFIRHLAEHNEMILAFMVDSTKDIKYLDQLRKVSKNIFFETIAPKTKKITSAVKALLTSQPISIPYFYSKALQGKIDRFLDDHPIDIVFCFSSPTAEYLYRSKHYDSVLKNVPWVMDLVDVDSHKWRQYADTNAQALRWLYNREANYLLQYERRIVSEFQHTLLVSDAEKCLLGKYSSTSNTKVVCNGVDLQYFSPCKGIKRKKAGPTIVFTGAMDYWPNIDGVKWFAHDIFPLIQKEIPNVQFQIVGSQPSSEVSDLEKIVGISVTGFVDDIRNYLASADVCVVPLRIARGIQNKVLEAMAMGRAVVCSEEAVEGIKGEPGKDLIVAQDSATFAHEVTRLLTHPNEQQDIGRKARVCMERNHSWANSLEKLDSLFGDLLETQ